MKSETDYNELNTRRRITMLSIYNEKHAGQHVRSYVRGFGRVHHGKEQITFRPMEGVKVIKANGVLFAYRTFNENDGPVYLGLVLIERKVFIATREEMVKAWPKKSVAAKQEVEEEDIAGAGGMSEEMRKLITEFYEITVERGNSRVARARYALRLRALRNDIIKLNQYEAPETQQYVKKCVNI